MIDGVTNVNKVYIRCRKVERKKIKGGRKGKERKINKYEENQTAYQKEINIVKRKKTNDRRCN